jgi:AcrR family transcriptional regulator
MKTKKANAGTRKRSYRMGDRAVSAAETRQRIVDAAIELTLEHWYDEITLRQIAASAGVALQTVVNHFGTKEGILTAVVEQPAKANLTRATVAPDDIESALDALMRDYETAGDAIVRSLALEGRIPALGPFLERGRKEHRRWLERAFPSVLTGLKGAARRRRLDLLVVATDVYTWKLLRRDRKQSAAQTRAAIGELVEALRG